MTQDDRPTLTLRLFVAGNSASSLEARHDLELLVDEFFNGRCVVEVTDIVADPKAALVHHVLATPMLVRESPKPTVRIIGQLSAKTKVLAALRMSEL